MKTKYVSAPATPLFKPAAPAISRSEMMGIWRCSFPLVPALPRPSRSWDVANRLPLFNTNQLPWLQPNLRQPRSGTPLPDGIFTGLSLFLVCYTVK